MTEHVIEGVNPTAPRSFSFPGSLLPAFGHGRCCHCRKPWYAATPREVSCGGGRSQFAVCVTCWPDLTPDQRLGYHAWISVMVWSRISAAEWAVIAAEIEP